MKEQWKKIPSHPKYEVSNLGIIRRLVAEERTFVGRIIKPSTKGKYGHLSANLGRNKKVMVHRMVLEAFVGPCPNGFEARHLNGKAYDNRLINLCWGSPKENCSDKIRHGTAFWKLSKKLIKEIQSRFTGKWGEQTILAKEYKVSQVRISQIFKMRREQPANR